MLVDLVAQLILWIVDLGLAALSAVIPDVVIDTLSEGAAGVAPLIQVTPVTTVVALVVAGYLVETAIDAFYFLMETYKLIPFKAS